jgi:DHA3 family macrolide efflux protein-like MFS transporter
MVPQKHLSRVNGINYLVNGGIQIVGPIVGALALNYLLLQELLWLDTVTFLVAIVPTILITIPAFKRAETKTVEKSSFKSEFFEGVTFIREAKGLFPLLMAFTGANFFLSPLFTQIPILVKIIHFGDEDALALVLAMQQIGMLLGSFIMSSWKGFENNAKGVAFGLFIGYIGMYMMVFAPLGNFIALGAGLFVTGFVLPVANVSSETIWAKTVPKDKLGRVYAVRRTIAQISAPVGMLLGGGLAEIFMVVPVLAAFTTGGVLLLAYSWAFTSLPQVEKLVEESKQEIPSTMSPTAIEN